MHARLITKQMDFQPTKGTSLDVLSADGSKKFLTIQGLDIHISRERLYVDVRSSVRLVYGEEPEKSDRFDMLQIGDMLFEVRNWVDIDPITREAVE